MFTIDRPVTIDEAMNISPVVLAFVGDAVETLYVRTRLSLESSAKSGKLHRLTAERINAHSQAVSAAKVMPLLDDTEISVFHHGRNTHTTSQAKNASPADYHNATGFEALLGFLYLTGRSERLDQLLTAAFAE